MKVLRQLSAILSFAFVFSMKLLPWFPYFENPPVRLILYVSMGAFMLAFACCAFKEVHRYEFLMLVAFAGIFFMFTTIFFTEININISDVPVATYNAAQMLFSGRNPYEWIPLYAFSRGGYRYLPTTLLYYAPFVALGVDIRYGNILANLVIFLLFVALGRDDLGVVTATIYFLFPLTLSSIYSGSNDVVWVMFLLLTIYLLRVRRSDIGLSAVTMALSITAKQFAIVVLPFILLWIYKNRRRDATKWSALLLLVVALITLPFFIWNPNKFVEAIILDPGRLATTAFWGIEHRQLEQIGLAGLFFSAGLEEYLPYLQLATILGMLLLAAREKQYNLSKLALFSSIALLLFIFFNLSSPESYYSSLIPLFISSLALRNDLTGSEQITE